MSRKLEEQYVQLLCTYNRHQWENYAEGAEHCLADLDASIYRFARLHPELSGRSGRRAETWRALRVRDLVDRHPDVARLRDRLDLDSREQYREGPHCTEADMAVRMAPDVLALMRLRNHLSRELGFRSYVHLVFYSEELSPRPVRRRIERYVTRNLSAARRLIARRGLSLPTWFSDLRSIGPARDDPSPDRYGEQFLSALGLSDLHERITLVTRKDGFGFCRPLHIPGDVRVLLGPRRDLASRRTLYHELGHALGHAANAAEGLYRTYTQVHDETMAVVGEMVGLRMVSSRANWQQMETIALLENVRCGISCLFEFDLWENPSRAEDLYRQHYARLGLPVPHPEVWALDTFRSLDPVYNHNYVLGRLAAEATLRHLEDTWGDDYAAWGRWLRKNYYCSGRARPLADKLAPVVRLC